MCVRAVGGGRARHHTRSSFGQGAALYCLSIDHARASVRHHTNAMTTRRRPPNTTTAGQSSYAWQTVVDASVDATIGLDASNNFSGWPAWLLHDVLAGADLSLCRHPPA